MMKKLLCGLILAISLCVSAVADIDIKSMSDDELLNLLTEIQTEIDSRELLDNRIDAGIYEVGKDIKAGRYKFTAAFESATIGVCTDLSAANAQDPTAIIFYQYISMGDDYSFRLEEGQTLVCEEAGIIELASEKSWAQ